MKCARKWEETKTRDTAVHGEIARYKTEEKERRPKKGKAGVKKEGGTGRAFIYIREEARRRDWNESALVRPNGLRKNADTVIWCRGR